MQRVKIKPLIIAPMLVLVTACGGGEGGGDIGFADGQDPDPVVLDVPIAYIKRPIPTDEDMMLVTSDIREPVTFSAGADLFLRDRASPTAMETNLTFEFTGGEGDVRDVNINAAGTKLVFAMRAALLEDVDDDEQPSWNVWEYEIESAVLRRIIASDINAEAGQDISPAYLPDGRIVFASTRQRQAKAILLDEGKPQFSALDEDENVFAFNLHVMNDDGSEVRQITFNQSHDLYPMVSSDGNLVFSRWGAKGNNNAIALYSSKPDGIDTQLLYGANSAATGSDDSDVQFLRPTQMPDGRIAVLLQPFEATLFGGQITLIDTDNFVENGQALGSNSTTGGPAQVPATVNEVRTDDLPSRGGRYSGFYPLFDGTDRLFISWSQCRLVIDEQNVPCTDANLLDPGAVEAAPLYGVWVYDRSDDTQLPIVAPEEGIMYTDIVAAQPTDLPPIVFDQTGGVELDAELFDAGVGVINIKSVYDFDGIDVSGPGITALADPAQFTAAQRPRRFVRIVKAVSLPDDDVIDIDGSSFGRNRNQGMREIIGYAPVEPDGSVQVQVPANTALALTVLDENGQRIGTRHQAWITVRPGEILTCNGCHDDDTGLSHGRKAAFAPINVGAVTTSLPFPNTDPALFADFGETMAETRARISCATDCASQIPTVDVVFEDVWTHEPDAGRAPDASFAMRYADLTTAQPVSAACQAEWTAQCRTVIHYEEHIHPLWSLPRQTLDVDGVTVLEDRTCTSCHTPVDAMAAPQVPLAQLDLTDGQSNQDADQFKSYRELLFNDNEQVLEMGALQDLLVEVGTDPVTMDPILETVNVAPSMNANAARFAGGFFDRFAPGASHADYLSPAELRLLSEWMDVGAQYYNDPFAAPQD